MADPFGILVNAITLADYIFTSIQTLTAAGENEAGLVALVMGNALSLRRFVETFSCGLVPGITPAEQQIFSDICVVLMPELEQFQSVVIRAGASESRLRRIADRVRWLAYRKRHLQAIADSAVNWTSLFQGYLASLPSSSRISASQHQEPDALSAKHDQMHRLSNYFGRLALMARTKNAEKLQLDSGHVEIKDVLGTLRSAKFDGLAAVVEYRSYEAAADDGMETPARELEEQVCRLAAFLSYADPFTMNVLKCQGYVHEPQLHRFGLVFSLPARLGLQINGTSAEVQPETLLSFISSGCASSNLSAKPSKAPRVTLDERFRVASMVAIAVFYLQTHNWLHEAIRSDNILLLQDIEKTGTACATSSIGYPFLIRFDSSRSTDGFSSLRSIELGTRELSRLIYCHPDRNPIHGRGEVRHQLCHDVYSIGVVLLEIGLWVPLSKVRPVRDSLKRAETEEGPGTVSLQKVLLELATEKLPLTMGTKYCDAVVYCLNQGTTDSYQPLDFLGNVVERLWDIRVSIG